MLATLVDAPRGVVHRLSQALGVVLATLAGLLVAAEIVVLLAGVCARYFLARPLIWGDELASILFIWLAMLGAALALQRDEHMRMTVFSNGLSARARVFLDRFVLCVAIAFLLMILKPAFDFAIEDMDVATPALEISSAWLSMALPVGFSLMLAVALLRLIGAAERGVAVVALLAVALFVAAFYLASPYLPALGNLNLVLFFVVLFAALVFAAAPIAFAFALATFGYIALTTTTPTTVIVGRMDEGMSHLILLAVPLFVFLGLLIEMTGMARAMVGFLASLLGHVRGGLQYVLIGAMYLVSGISGSKAADMAAVAPVLFPEMIARGAKPGDLVALLAATGAQTETVPPSLVLITIGSVTGVSIAALFTGGLVPSAVLAVALIVVARWRYRHEDLSHVKRATPRQVLRAFVVALPALALPFLIRAAVVGGVATATEVSTIGIVYAFVAGLVFYREFRWSRLPAMLVETASLSGAILFIIGAATAMAWALTQSGFSTALAAAMTKLPGGTPVFLGVSILVFIALGSVLEGIPAIVLFGPLMFPIARQIGVNEVHYAMVVVLAMGIGLFAPPFGVGYYAACAISRVHPDQGVRPMAGYVLALLIGTIVVAAIPWLSTGLLK
ncbi:MAG: TRAP transporter large permease subunit [Pseudomonadota bacterium]|nr:TRAP transporter large permease subunit [Pseudomonadota bacterium]